VNAYRINVDGTGLTPLIEPALDATHAVSYSPDHQYFVDLYSRVDLPPVMQLRRVSDGRVVSELEHADASALLATGWRPPEVFTSLGRDEQTAIWGVIVRPMNFDSTRTYPVIENIYAGPQGSFVRKTFSNQLGMQALAELGFIRRADRRDGYVEPIEGVPRRGVEESRRRRLPRSHPVAQGGGGDVPLLSRQTKRSTCWSFRARVTRAGARTASGSATTSSCTTC